MARLSSSRRSRAGVGFIGALTLLAGALVAATWSAPPRALGVDALPGPRDPVAAARAGEQAGASRPNQAPSGAATAAAPTVQPAAAQPGSCPPSSSPQVATYCVFATQYNPLTAGSVEVAVPDKCVKFAAQGNTSALNQANCGPGYPLGLDYRVVVTRSSGQSATIRVNDTGPWNVDDNYWDPADPSYPRPRRLFGDLARGTPESQAAFYNGYNTVSNCKNLDGNPSGHPGGADQFGRCVLNPSAIDLSVAAASQLGLGAGQNDWVTVSYLWEPLDSGFLAYPFGFRGGVFVAGGEFNGDSRADVVTGADQGGGPQVRAFTAKGSPIGGFFAYPTGFGGGVRVAAGRFGLSSTDQIVTGAGPSGGPQVRTFTVGGSATSTFLAYASGFSGGVYVAAGNVDGVPGDEIVTGAGKGGGPHVRVFRQDGTAIGGFFPYAGGFTGGVRVAVGDVNGDGTEEIITGPGPSGGPQVRIFRLDGTAIGGFWAYSGAFTGGIYVGTVRSPDNKTDWIVTGAGEGGGTHVRVFRADGSSVGGFFVDSTAYGARVAGGSFDGTLPGQLAVSEGPGSVPLVRFRRTNGSILFP
jgi:hypothetical protein